MGFGKHDYTPPPTPTQTGLEDDQISNAQEAVPVPFLCGERKIALRWITRVYNQRAAEAPLDRPSKKGN